MSAGKCEVCGDAINPGGPEDIIDHLRVVHPELYGDGPERWPDGALVIEGWEQFVSEEFGDSS